VVGLLPGGPPVLEQGQGGSRLGVGGHRLLDQPGADQLEGFAFPGLVLAAVLGELAGADAEAEARKPPPASIDASCRSSPTRTTLARAC
jgi:hypothetical protein